MRKYSKFYVESISIHISRLKECLKGLAYLEDRCLDLGYMNGLNMSYLRLCINIGDGSHATLSEYGFRDNEEAIKYIEVRNRIVEKGKFRYELLPQ